MSLFAYDNSADRLLLTRKTALAFRERAIEHDQHNTFPYQNIEDLKKIGYPALTLGKGYGGLGVSLEEMLKHQAIIAEMDGSTALAIGWHVGITQHLNTHQEWDQPIFERFAKDVKDNGALINNAASEAGTGSPTRGGLPETTAYKTATGWVISGRKTFTTLSPVLDYFVVSARIGDSHEVGQFLVHKSREGLSIDETWNSVAMRATGSHDLVLKDVVLNQKDFLYTIVPSKKVPQGWLLHIPAVYQGIATAAFDYAVNFANHYAPNSLVSGTIAQFPTVQQKIGAMKLKLIQNEYLLYGVARDWDKGSQEERLALADALATTKISIVENALAIVDLAMRLVGAQSLSANNPLQRYYRDVRAGLHNPPMEDIVLVNLAKSALASAKTNQSKE